MASEMHSTKKKGNPEREMSFWEHLEELRGTLIKSVIAVLLFAILAFINRHLVFDTILLAPKDADFITTRLLCRFGRMMNLESLCFGNIPLQIISIQMSGQFMMHMMVSLAAGLVAAFPYIIYQFWSFITPALKPEERKYSNRAVIVISLLFMSGVLFSYFLVVPLTINFLGTYQVSEAIVNQISLNSYIGTIVSVTLGVGLVFELPVLVYFLARIGLLTPAYMKRNRKYMLVIILTVSAIITPPDVFSQILVSIPLLILYELSIYIARRVNPGT